MGASGEPSPEVRALLRRKSPETRIAVVGASNSPHKYGNIITRNLKAKGYTVLPVNPHEETIAGLPVAHRLAELARPVDLVVFVTPPDVTREVLQELAGLDLGAAAWLQDGAFDEQVLRAVEQAPFEVVHHACVMVVSNW